MFDMPNKNLCSLPSSTTSIAGKSWMLPRITSISRAQDSQATKGFISSFEAPTYVDGNGVQHYQGPAS